MKELNHKPGKMSINSFPKEFKFQKTWRSYQSKVLQDLEEHLEDNHLHVIAAPGSGKTVLGLEVIRRLNKPTLILSPTRPIRDQWVDRLVGLFLPDGIKEPEWVSNNIVKPKFLTSITYQALHCAYAKIGEEKGNGYSENGEEDPDEINGKNDKTLCVPREDFDVDIIKILRDAGIKVIAVDECHHLRTEWWKSLMAVKDALDNPVIIALTATPPYDVPPAEWQRYQNLCGPVDAEIAVPELVLTGDLCPHQDYVYFSAPTDMESNRIIAFRLDVEQFFKDICVNKTFIDALLAHPWMEYPQHYIEQILSNPEYFSAMAIFLNYSGQEVPSKYFSIMGISKKRLPALDLDWLEMLLTNCIYSDEENFAEYSETLQEIKRSLSRIGAIEKRKVVLKNTKELNKILASSITKLDSIKSIVMLENDALKQNLRMVVLTDYIRKTDLPDDPQDIKPLNRIGVVPIFEHLRRSNIENIKLGVISGSVVIIPSDSCNALKNIANKKGIPDDELKIEPLRCDKRYSNVIIYGKEEHEIVSIITALFSAGDITVLVGTKSLLGEGWDAPSINSLVLASFVGTFMLSNQMRGRAIRKQIGNPDKTANIWHLICVELNNPVWSDDFETLARRFKAFMSVSFKEDIIEDGFDRLNIGFPPFSKERIGFLNEDMKKFALDRDGLRAKWDNALHRGDQKVHVVEEVRAQKIRLPRNFVFANTIAALFWQGLTWGGYVFTRAMDTANRAHTATESIRYLMIACCLAAIVALPSCLKALWLFIMHGPVESSARQIGEALLKTLIHMKTIKTDPSKLEVATLETNKGIFACSLEGATSYEKSVFLIALQEIFDPIDNPRYLLIRKTFLGRWLRKDYHAVPQIIGNKKEYVEYFARMWSRYVGSMSLVYTRIPEGRKILLKARSHSVSAAFQKRSEKRSCWK